MADDRILNLGDLAEYLNVSRTTARTISRQPNFPLIRLPGVRKAVISERHLRAWLDEQAKGGAPAR